MARTAGGGEAEGHLAQVCMATAAASSGWHPPIITGVSHLNGVQAYGRSQHVAPNAVSVQVWASFAAAKKLMLQMLMARTQDGFILRGAGGSDGGQECGPEGGQASVGHAGRERAEDAPDDNSSGNPETSVEDLSKLKLSEFVASRDQVNAMWRAKDVRIPRY
ncbi:hypothetical protein WJX72_005950 [[Myrmecia] bisecta]|uniref:Uncharacterized protein n=1 Tax=[Myrmecia] bisecta TaxID=41462 RepID=A0AAW1PNV7_9CHLO